MPVTNTQTAVYHYSHSGVSASNPGEYQSQLYEATGAGPTTMFWMMGMVVLAYCLLFIVMCTSCCMAPRVRGFARMHDVEAAPNEPKVPPQATVVAALDKAWRNDFISKVYAILSIQLAVTVAIGFVMMQCVCLPVRSL